MKSRLVRARALPVVLAAALALGSGCEATGRTANAYFDWGGRVFTTNPGSVAFYFVGFGAFFVAGLPLDLFSWIATAIGWSDGSGEDYQASALAPSIFLGTTGGALLGAPFFPLGLPWWVGSDDTPEPSPPANPAPAPVNDGGGDAPVTGAPTREGAASTPKSPAVDNSPPAGAPH